MAPGCAGEREELIGRGVVESDRLLDDGLGVGLLAEACECERVDREDALFVGVFLFDILDELEEVFELFGAIGGDEMDAAGGDGEESFAILGGAETSLLRGNEGIANSAEGEHQPGVGGEGLDPGGGHGSDFPVVFLSEFAFAAEIVGLGEEEEEEGILVVDDKGIVARGDGGLGVGGVKKSFVDGGGSCCGVGVSLAAIGKLRKSGLSIIGAIEVNQRERFVDE